MDPREWMDHEPSVERWLRFKAETTKKVYKIVLDEFLAFVGPQIQSRVLLDRSPGRSSHP